MAKFRDELLKLANPTPLFKDPEVNSDDETAAKIVEHEEDFGADVDTPSALRSSVPNILADTDTRYSGKRTSRKHLQDDSLSENSGDSESEEDDDDGKDNDMMDSEVEDDADQSGEDSVEDDEEEEDDIASFQSKVNKDSAGQDQFTFANDGNFGQYGDDSDEKDDDSDDNDDDKDTSDDNSEESEGSGEDSEVEDDQEGDGIKSFSTSASDDIAKGQAAKQQLGLWDSLLEGRIKLQKATSLVNQLPQGDGWQQFEQDSTQFAEEAALARQAVKHLLDSLVHLQDLLLVQNKETSQMLNNEPQKGKTGESKKETDDKPPAVEDSEDEEIPSDSEDDEVGDKTAATPEVKVKKRKLQMDEYPGFLKKRYETFLPYRDATIQKWYDRTRLAGGSMKGKSFSAFDQSALVQINQILADRERLIKRTQLKRTTYRVLGTKPKPEQPELVPTDELHQDERVAGPDDTKDYDEEIFDDDDFYHQLLRELIEKKSSDTSDPVALSRQWLEIQKLRTKSRRKIDTRASKGRKIRYHVHKKLVNFMAPVDNCAWSHEARDDLYKSLFGKRFESSATI